VLTESEAKRFRLRMAQMTNGKGELISRNGNVFRGFTELATWIAEHLKAEDAVLDGEFACIDGEGRVRPDRRSFIFVDLRCRSLYLPNEGICQAGFAEGLYVHGRL
jgi:hypothetical protein